MFSPLAIEAPLGISRVADKAAVATITCSTIMARLMQIADRCPIHRTLGGTIQITTSEMR